MWRDTKIKNLENIELKIAESIKENKSNVSYSRKSKWTTNGIATNQIPLEDVDKEKVVSGFGAWKDCVWEREREKERERERERER